MVNSLDYISEMRKTMVNSLDFISENSIKDGDNVCKNNLYALDAERFLNDTSVFSYWLNLVPEERKDKVLKFKFPNGQRLSLGAGILLYIGLKRAGFSYEKISVGANGKPYIKEADIHFNLSHAGNFAVLAVSDRKVGVDIEKKRSFKEGLVRYVFTEEEQQFVDRYSADSDFEYTRLWTIKESVMKYFGLGLSLSPQKICVLLNPEESVKVSCSDSACGDYCQKLHFTEFSFMNDNSGADSEQVSGADCYHLTVCSEYPRYTSEIEFIDLNSYQYKN